ncbi:hypothetical protein [Geomonas azotofigens]|uniref:hypothetical protein n=1 Tax=Geomonas azotofigens TaxID=2843196 RepID=UPI001C10D1B3|nr:hypothetical protein [Geomonas azotofigens]MBU5613208.1 hypothetical protein [Geomonas azotofigens]
MKTMQQIARALALQAAVVPLMLAQAQAGNVGVDVNIHLGNEPRPVVVAPAPRPVVVAPAPVPVYQPDPYYDEPEEEVQFIYPQPLGFYVAVGVPYDLFYFNNVYFSFRDGRWFRSPDNRGRWVPVGYRELPPPLRRYRIERIREYRAREYAVYQRDRDHYHGRHRSDRGYWKARHEQQKDEKRYTKEQRKEEKRYEKEQRKEDLRFEKEQRKEQKRHEHEQRREDRDFDRDRHGRD